ILRKEEAFGKDLEHTYKKALALAGTNDTLLRENQRSWLKYQESQCELEKVTGSTEGPGYGLLARAACLLHSTLARLQELREIVTTLEMSAAHAQTTEKCSCVGNICNNACMSPAGPDVVAALRKRFPDLDENDITVFDDRQLPSRRGRSPYTVAFSTKNWNMACDLWLNPIRLCHFRTRHA